MRILAIETSCDETSIAILDAEGGFESPSFCVLANIVSSQASLHAGYGGVFPNLAKREHLKNLPLVLDEALKTANSNIRTSDILILGSREKELKNSVGVIAVTYGPGLEPALWTGIEFAKDLAKKWNKPLVAVNHMEGHIASVLLTEASSRGESPAYTKILAGRQKLKVTFPTIALLVSGGHTEIVYIKNWLDYEIIGETRDDAAGEAFDKAARMLGLGYPGGPAISARAEEFSPLRLKSLAGQVISLPRPMLHSKDYDFSFSGLKTALLYLIRDIRKERESEDIFDLVPELAHEFQNAVVEILVAKTIRAVKEYNAESLILAGGVANNKLLQTSLAEAVAKSLPHTALHIPQTLFTTDNASMIGAAGYLRVLNNDFIQKFDSLRAVGTLRLGKTGKYF